MKIITAIKPLLENKMEFNPTETMGWLTYNQPVFWSFGVSKMINLSNKGLLLRVSARRHKGWILITLNGSDLYDVYLVNTLGKVKKEIKDVYCDGLLDTIDEQLSQQMDLIEEHLLEACKRIGADSIRTKAGTVIRTALS